MCGGVDRAPHGELQVCVGTSERVRGRVSVDMGMCVQKARVRGSGQVRVAGCAHPCKCRMRARGAGACASSPCCKLWLQTQTWGPEGTARGSSGRTPPSFLLPDLYLLYGEETTSSEPRLPPLKDHKAIRQLQPAIKAVPGKHRPTPTMGGSDSWAGVTGVPQKEPGLSVIVHRAEHTDLDSLEIPESNGGIRAVLALYY